MKSKNANVRGDLFEMVFQGGDGNDGISAKSVQSREMAAVC